MDGDKHSIARKKIKTASKSLHTSPHLMGKFRATYNSVIFFFNYRACDRGTETMKSRNSRWVSALNGV